nr:uncharacterized protein LOC112790986 [Arachis hypogaea]
MWIDEETEAFVGFMEECVVDGLKADCGQFRPGTFEKLALKMLEAFPTCTVTAKHCKNKHKRLKEKYQYASEMLACSGFGWNSEKQCIDVDSGDVLDAWMKVVNKLTRNYFISDFRICILTSVSFITGTPNQILYSW